MRVVHIFPKQRSGSSRARPVEYTHAQDVGLIDLAGKILLISFNFSVINSGFSSIINLIICTTGLKQYTCML